MDINCSNPNPLNDKALIGMVKNVQQNIGALKTSKELAPEAVEEEQHREPTDLVEFAKGAEEMSTEEQQEQLEAAHRSGVLADLKKQGKEDKADKLNKQGFAELTEKEEAERMQKPQPVKEDRDITRDIAEIKADVPTEHFEAAKKIVEGQIDVKTQEPAKSLTALKETPETRLVNTQPETFHPIMDIHDKNNQPQLIEVE